MSRHNRYWRTVKRPRNEYSWPSARDLWFMHKARCTQCGEVDFKRPVTVALACIEGANLLKANLQERNKK